MAGSRKLTVEFVGDTKNLERAFGRAGGSASKGSQVIGDAAKVGALAIGGLGVAAVNAAGDYEKSLNVFQAVSGATGKEMGKVGKVAKQLGADVKLPGTSAADAAVAMTELAKGGLSVKDSMSAARGVLQLSAAAQVDNKTAATIAARALNAFSLKGKEATRVSDLLAGAANASTAEMGDIAAGMQMASASAANLGIPIEDLTTALALMANKGIAGSDAGTSLKTMMSRLIPETLKAQKAVGELGVAVFDNNGEFIGVREAIKRYSRALKDLSPQERQHAIQTIFGSDAQRAANIVLGGGVKQFDNLKKSVTEQGAAQKMAEAQTKGFKGSLEAFKSTLETLAITFGTVLLPAATSVMRTLSTMFGGLGEHKTLVLAITGAVGGLSVAIVAVNLATKAWAATTAAATAIQAGFNAVFIANPIGLVVVALAALVAALIVAYKESDTFRKIVDGAWKVMKDVADWLVTAGKAAFDTVSKAVRDAWTTIRDLTSTVWNNGVKQTLKVVFEAIKLLVTTYFGIYKTIITTAWGAIKTVTETVWGAIKTVATAAWTALSTAATTSWDAIKAAILTPIRAARDVIGGKDGIWAQIKEVAGTAWEGIRKAIKTAADPILDVILAPFKAAVKGVAKFAKLILKVVGAIPGVNTDGPIKAIDGFIEGLAKGGKFGGTQGFARGGAFKRTGGVVNRPITLMGEEAPRHPEFVIPTNPAYRKRARGLLAQAAGVIGLADGGVISAFRQAISRTSAVPKAQLALFEAGIVESGLENLPYGHADSRGALQIRDSTAGPMGINNMDPLASAMAFLTRGFWGKGSAISLARNNPTMSAGWVAQNTQGSDFPHRYDQVMGQALAYLKGKGAGAGFDAVGNLAAGLNPADLIKKLPGVGDLPDWLTGMGKWVLDKVGGFIKDKIGTALVGKGTGNVQKAIMLATSMGHPHPTDGQISGGRHTAGSLHYAGRAVDFGDAGQSVEKMQKLFNALASTFGDSLNELFYDRMPWFIDNHRRVQGQFGGHLDHIHAAFFKGGKYGGMPFVGSYATGGVVPRTGMAMVHQGETITPAGVVPEVHVYIGGERIDERIDVRIVERDRRSAARFGAGLVTS